MDKIKVLDLFAGTQSVKKELSKKYNIVKWLEQSEGLWVGYTKIYETGGVYIDSSVVEYIGIDIYSPEEKNIHFNLLNDDVVGGLLNHLPYNWKPDFIWASPVCNKFSAVLTGKCGNYYFEIEDNKIKPRTNWNIKVQPHMEKYQNKAGHEKAYIDSKQALRLHEATKSIIKYFKVPFAIENPANALTKYIYTEFKRSIAHYCMYGFDYKKPTAIYSNIKLSLLKCNGECGPLKKWDHHISLVGCNSKCKYKPHTPSHWNKKHSTYAKRSSVPSNLVNQIMKECL